MFSRKYGEVSDYVNRKTLLEYTEDGMQSRLVRFLSIFNLLHVLEKKTNRAERFLLSRQTYGVVK